MTQFADRTAEGGATAPPSVHDQVDFVAAGEGDSGKVETLPDGSLSIPVLEERLVVTKRTYVRERIIVSKEAVTETEHIEDVLRKEQVEVEVEERD